MRPVVRRAQIVEATIGCLADLGWTQTSYARIAERAGLSSTRLISYHFADKDELMTEIVGQVFGLARAVIRPRMSAAEGPRDVVAAVLPDPATLGDRMHGKTCAGLWVTGKGKDGNPRQVYLYHVVDNAWSMAEYGSQAVVWQTAVNPVVALELLARGTWQGTGVLGPEAFDAVPFLDLLTEYGSPWGIREGG